ncbi:hypothetical protein Dalk_4870 [Desulfatibacillum aliphaticivorans]|uniref:Uncharacterized protein n=1 Tax=Desulfatibacillum aliphaticivorans TaxID=218208 RepID=B8FDB5_DESAL|nr:hypothetical protein [Desulfatibacillum aliphaticivorans]ACL06546.1 hypothetical protein Dalk_4870 [Desulfatibacillum aliphaticivorans]
MNQGKNMLKQSIITVAAGALILAVVLLWAPERLHRTVAVICFSICAAGFLAAACVYFFTPKFLSYHQQASGLDWEELSPQFQGMILSALRIVAGGFFCSSSAVIILLAIPYRQGLAWAAPAIFVIYNFMAVPALYGTYIVAARTPANPPFVPVILAITLSSMGLILSL